MIEPDRIMELFAAASELPTAERPAFLARECAGQTDLLVEVESLLKSKTRVDQAGFLQDPALHEMARQTALTDAQEKRTGELFGRYRVIQLLGEGGMGEVYLAQDTELDRQVALKLIKSPIRTDELLDRFGREGHILAHLNHDSIARLLDAGTSDSGVPFLVMEYVDGKPITEHCDWHGLTVSARLELFRTVCAAVQYAHQNVVVHRDLKPGNILVTAEGQVKLLDFGIAKLLDSPLPGETRATLVPALTPEYASPEQVKGEPTTTATDVYSLGVILYELLTGARLFKLKRPTAEEMLRAICEQEPRVPSTIAGTDAKSPMVEIEGGVEKLRRRLRGDLDHIVLKALRKEPEARYPTVEQFSDDIGRHLEGLPVRARRRTFRYRAAKFVRRHRAGVTAATLVALAMIGGSVATAWEARVAIRQRNEARQLAHTVLFDYHDAIAALPGSTPVRKRLVTDALIYLNGISKDSNGDVELQLEIAAAYLRVGDVQGRPYMPNLGQTEPALQSYRTAQRILEPILARHPANTAARRELANAFERIGNIQLREYHLTEGIANQHRALLIREQLSAQHPSDSAIQSELANNYLSSGDLLQASCFVGSSSPPACLQDALASQQRALDMFQDLSRQHSGDLDLRRNLARAYTRVGFRQRDIAHQNNDDSMLGVALESERRAMQIRQEVAAADPTNDRDRRNVADQRMLMSDAQATVGDLPEAIAGYRESISAFQSISGADPVNAEARRDLANVHFKLAKALAQDRQATAARQSYNAALAFVHRLLTEDPANGEDRQLEAGIFFKMSELAESVSDFPQAADLYGRFLALSPADYYSLYRKGHLNIQAAEAKQTAEGDRVRYWAAARDALRPALAFMRARGGPNASTETERIIFRQATEEMARAEAALSAHK